jgi:hypothetical protein
MKEFIAQWSKRQWIFFLVVVACFSVPIILGLVGSKGVTPNDWLILLTGLVVLVYTIETQGLRFEMVRQNDLAIRPFLVLFMKGNRWERRLAIKNIGKGAALFVRIDDVPLREVVGDVAAMRDRIVGGVATLSQYNYIGAGEEAVVQALCTTDPQAGSIYLGFEPSIDPDTAQDNYELTIHYQDVESRTYQTRMRMGKDGVELIKPASWE